MMKLTQHTAIPEGTYFEALDCYLAIERSGNKLAKVFFSDDQPPRDSKLAEHLITHVTDGAPCPKVELDLSDFNEFRRRISLIVKIIPRGGTMTYGEVAAKAGHPEAARAVGQVMASNPFVILVPCHRVVAKEGLGGFAFGLEAKEKLLELEADEP